MSNYFIKLRSHRFFAPITFLIIIFMCFFAYRTYIWSNTQSTDNAYLEADISSVSSEVSGIIDEILVDENNPVTAGQIVAKIKHDDYQALLEKASSILEGASKDIEIIEQNINLAGIEESKAKETFEFSQANLKFIKADFDRTQKLSKDNYASQQKLDSSEIELEKAKNEFTQAQLNMQKSKTNLVSLEVQRLAALAKLNITKQEVILAKRNLDNTIIRSPIDGKLGNSSLKLGNYIRTGVVLFSVVPQKLYLKANFKETQISKFKPGMKVIFTVDSAPGYQITGHIRNISPATGSKFSLLPPANATGNFTKIVQRVPVIIDFEIPNDLINTLTPGMSATVNIRN